LSDISVPFASAVLDAVRVVARDEILSRFRSVAAQRKADGSIVTEADVAAQHALVERLTALEAVPVLGEEMAREEQEAILRHDGRYWCVDPLDGTANFANGVPYFAISVALMEGARPVFGTVFDPVRDEAFYAVAGGGSFLNAQPLRVPDTAPALAEAIVEVSLRRDTKELRGTIKRHPPYRKRLTSGSSTLSWCHLAAARIDAILNGGQKLWDYAAGALILEEARGFTSTIDEDDFWQGPAWSKPVIAARSGPLHAEWRTWVRGTLFSARKPDDGQ